MKGNKIDIPSIGVCTREPNKVFIKEIIAGVEEEGIPIRISDVETENCNIVDEAYITSQQSSIGIAIGIKKNRIILHYDKRKKDDPITDMTLNIYEKEKARIIGGNAARLYKILPLKNTKSFNDELIKEITEVVISVMEKLNI